MIGTDLNKICDGHLQREFARLLPDVLTAVEQAGKKASITFRITVELVDGEPGVPPAFCFTATVKPSLPSRRKTELYNWSGGELSGSGVTMPLPFPDTAEAGDA